MGRILAVDFGLKRTGLAVSDELRLIANGLTTVRTSELLVFLSDYIPREGVDCVVVGEPKQMSGIPSEIESNIKGFIKGLAAKFPTIKIERCDERFTSQMAFDTMITAGLKKKDRQNKELVDTISATIILQTYMG